jgi:hypothetical protein
VLAACTLYSIFKNSRACRPRSQNMTSPRRARERKGGVAVMTAGAAVAGGAAAAALVMMKGAAMITDKRRKDDFALNCILPQSSHLTQESVPHGVA